MYFICRSYLSFVLYANVEISNAKYRGSFVDWMKKNSLYMPSFYEFRGLVLESRHDSKCCSILAVPFFKVFSLNLIMLVICTSQIPQVCAFACWMVGINFE